MILKPVSFRSVPFFVPARPDTVPFNRSPKTVHGYTTLRFKSEPRLSDSDRVLLYILSQNNKIRALDVLFSETPYETQKAELMNR